MGKVIVPCKYDDAWFFSEGLVRVKLNGKWGYLDNTGKEIIPLKYDEAYNFFDGLAVVGLNDKYGYIDKTGKETISLKFDDAYNFFDGLAAVKMNGKWGYINRMGEEVVPCQYDDAGDISEGLAAVKLNGKWGFISVSGASTPQQPARTTASPTNDSLTCDGAAQNPTVYKIGGSNYFKIRDVAAMLDGTGKQFAVGYDGQLKSVTATTGQGYAKQPGDLAGAPAGGNKTAEISSDTIYVNGEKVDAEVYKIDGSNYFKLRDLGKALDFYVGWSQERGVYIETDKSYS